MKKININGYMLSKTQMVLNVKKFNYLESRIDAKVKVYKDKNEELYYLYSYGTKARKVVKIKDEEYDNIEFNCPFCEDRVVKTTNDKIYGKMYGNGMCYKCVSCDAYVGCHDDGKPLGTPANKELRALRKKCHDTLDPLWKSGQMSRNEVYTILSIKMNKDKNQTHVALFNEEDCYSCLKILKEECNE